MVEKWWWRFWVEENALLVKVIKCIHGEDGGSSRVGFSNRGGGGGVWGDILKVGCDIDKVGVDFSKSFCRKVEMGITHPFGGMCGSVGFVYDATKIGMIVKVMR